MNPLLRVARATALASWDILGLWGGEFTWLIKSPIKERIKQRAPESPYLLGRVVKKKRYPSELRQVTRESKIEVIKVLKVASDEELQKWEGKNVRLPRTSTPMVVRMALDEHHASKIHYDLRFLVPEDPKHPEKGGSVASFAIPKAKLPSLGEKVQVIQVDDKHGHKELRNPPIIPAGYGAGTTRNLQDGLGILVYHQDHWKVILPSGDGFNLIPTKNDYLFVRMKDSPKRGEPKPLFTRPWKSKEISDDSKLIEERIKDPNFIAERKYDGGMYFLLVDKEGKTSLISRRGEVRDGEPTGRGIDKSWQSPELKFAPQLQKFKDSQFVVEAYTEVSDNPHGHLTSLLNSSPAESWLQQESGLLRFKLLRIEKLRGKDISNIPYQEQIQLKEEIHREWPLLRIPKSASSEQGKRNLIKELKERGEEGVVFKHLSEPDFPVEKAKNYLEFDRPLVGFAQSQTGREEAGTALFLTSKGEVSPTQGISLPLANHYGFEKVDEFKRDVWEHPERYQLRRTEFPEAHGLRRNQDQLIGTPGITLKLKGLQEFDGTGKIRVPIIIGVHLDK